MNKIYAGEMPWRKCKKCGGHISNKTDKHVEVVSMTLKQLLESREDDEACPSPDDAEGG